jgi:hypothetical protein
MPRGVNSLRAVASTVPNVHNGSWFAQHAKTLFQNGIPQQHFAARKKSVRSTAAV